VNHGRSGISTIAERAAHKLRAAETLERRRAFDRVDAQCKAREAAQSRAEGERLLAPPERLVGDASHELVPAPTEAEGARSPARWHVLNTLEEPTVIAVDASEARAHAATKAGVLSPALDAAASVGASNSLEKMIAHHVAAAHYAAMEIFGRLADGGVRLPPVELARLSNAAARLCEVAQAGCITLQRLKTGNTQTVVVQHVTVGHGGQAVVAGQVGTGSPKATRKKGSSE
jgi:hypothetical protein